MRHLSAFGLIAMGLALGLGGLGAATISTTRSSTCPRHVRFPAGNIDDAVAAARRLLIEGHTVTSQGVVHRLTAKNTPILAAVELAPLGAAKPIPGASALRRQAASRCGASTARSAWAIVIDYPLIQIAAQSVRVSFVVRTDDGWRTF
jgi:hypothetical protein